MAANAGTTCLSGGAIAGIIFGSILGTIVVASVVALALWWLFKRKRKQSEKIIVVEKPESTSYENRAFKDENGIATRVSEASLQAKEPTLLSKTVQTTDSPRKKNSIFEKLRPKRSLAAGNPNTSTESLGPMKESVQVTLTSKNRDGLGFTIHGNMRDGIFVKEITKSGAAVESGNIKPGDRLMNVSMNFEKMVFEDALTILSYVSPYTVTLELQRTDIKKNTASTETIGLLDSGNLRFHPLFKSQSIGDLAIARVKTDALRSVSLASASPPEFADTPGHSPLKLSVIQESSPSMSYASNRSAADFVTTCVQIETVAKADDGADAGPTKFEEDDPYKELSAQDKLELVRLSYDEPSVTQSTPNIYAASSEEDATTGAGTPQPPSPQHSALTKTTNIGRSGEQEDAAEDSSDMESVPDLETAKTLLASHRQQQQAAATTPYPQFSTMTAVVRGSEEPPTTDDLPMAVQYSSPAESRRVPTEEGGSPGHRQVNGNASEMYQAQKYKLKPVGQGGGTLQNGSPGHTDVSVRTLSAPQPIHSNSFVSVNGPEAHNNNNNNKQADSSLRQDLDREQRKKLLFFQQQLAQQQEDLAKMGIHVSLGSDDVTQL